MKSLKRSTAMSTRLRRRNEFLAFLLEKYDVRCLWCSEPIEPRTFFEWRDDLTIHHCNSLHDDNRIENKEIMHRGCHKEYHLALNKHLGVEGKQQLDMERIANALGTI